MRLKRIGILDPDGEKPNPLTETEYSDDYKIFSKGTDGEGGWANLPMYINPKHPPSNIIKDIIENRVLILEAGTGNGKSVLVPKYALHALDYRGKVVVTNPKQVPTEKNARYAALCLDVEIGKQVGYQYRGSKLENGKPSKTPETNLLFSTDGSVVQVLDNDPAGSDYDIVIVDEAHERNVRIDTILLQMKKALKLNPNLRLIVMSATLPGNLFGEYYKEFNPKSINLPAIPNKPVKEIYLSSPISEKMVSKKIAETIIKEIVNKKKKGDIICFGNSLGDNKKTCEELSKLLKDVKSEKILCVPLASKSDRETKKIAEDMTLYKDQPGGPYDRKVVVGTDLIESSITIVGAVFVIDNGYSFSSGYDPDRIEEFLKPERISKAAAIQRKGRVGRTAPGECYRMYTKKEFENFDDDPVLEIRKERTEGLILTVMRKTGISNLGDALDYLNEFIEPPPKKLLDSGIKVLESLKILTSKNKTAVLTEKGQKVSLIIKDVSGDIQMANMLVSAYDYNCDFEICALVAILNYKDIEIKKLLKQINPDNKEEAMMLKAKLKTYSHEFGDLFTLLKIYKMYYFNVKKMTSNLLKEYCDRNFLNYYALSDIRRDHLKIWRNTRFLEDYRDVNVKKYDTFNNMLFSIISGYYINIAQKTNLRNKKSNYKNWFPKTKSVAKINQNSMLNSSNHYIFYVSLSNTPSGRNFNLCNRISKKQIDILNKLFGYNIEFGKRKSVRKLVSLTPVSRNSKGGSKRVARSIIKKHVKKLQTIREEKKKSQKKKKAEKDKKK
jgi:pre-mRNA-splicing factor ATP-dependent RNA helicase DHX15/PRP43